MEDMCFVKKCYQHLRKLGYCKSQYQFSEDFLGKCRHYYGMLLCEERHPSIDCIHNLIHKMSSLDDGFNKFRYLDELFTEGQQIITKRLMKYI